MTPAERAQRIQAMRDELAKRPSTDMEKAEVAYWCGWLECAFSDALPPDASALAEWIESMESMVGDHLNYWGPPEGWDGDDEGGAA